MQNGRAVKKSEKRNCGEIPFIWSRVGDPSDAFLRLYSRIFVDILEDQDNSGLERDHDEMGGSNNHKRLSVSPGVLETGGGPD